MRFFILVGVLALYALPSWGLNRADTIMSLLSLEEKVEMLFVVSKAGRTNDSVKVGNSSYVDYALFDTRNGISDALKVPYPSKQTMLAVRSKELKNKLYSSALHQYINSGYDGIVVPDTANGLSRIYIGNEAVANHNYIQVIAFPCDLLSDLIANVSVDVKAESVSLTPTSFFEYVELPSLHIWRNNISYGISFNDILDHDVLFWEDQSFDCRQQVINAFRYGKLDEGLLDQRIARLLNYKVEMNSDADLNRLRADQLDNRFDAFKNSISIYQKKKVLPFKRLDTLTASVVDLRKNTARDFINKARFYHPNVYRNNRKANVQIILCDNERVLRSKITDARNGFVLKKNFNVLVYNGQLSRRTMRKLKGFDAVVQMPERIKLSWPLLAQAIYGGSAVTGFNVFEEELKEQKLFATHASKNRLGLNFRGINSLDAYTEKKIDRIVLEAIEEKAMPGAQLMVLKSGNVILQKSYGHHTYEGKQEVSNTDLYDVASITKLAVTFPMVMQLYEDRVINLDATLEDYILGIDTTNKADITIRELLIHQSGLVSFIPFYNRALDRESLNDKALYSRHHSSLYDVRVDTRLYQNKNAAYRKDIFSTKQTGVYQKQVAERWFMNESYVDSMYNYIYASKINKEKEYRYSDLGYYLLQKIIEQEEKKDLDSLYYTHFSALLGANRLCYKPLDRFANKQIVPTENDLSFRRTQLDGYVHDQGAAMLGGVAAHAGLFANAGDLAKMGQMLLNEGQYGGVRFIQPKTIGEFTQTVNHGNRRGMGVDKPELDPDKGSPVSHLASKSSYGHTGFTGTILWIDPEHDLVYIFLSNRIYPDVYNKKLIEMNVRTKIQDVLYNSLVKS